MNVSSAPRATVTTEETMDIWQREFQEEDDEKERAEAAASVSFQGKVSMCTVQLCHYDTLALNSLFFIFIIFFWGGGGDKQ